MFPDWVEGYVGLPFKERGRAMDGADCYGLVRLVWEREFGIILPAWIDESWAEAENDAAGRKRVAAALATLGYAAGDWIALGAGEEGAGDGVLLRMLGFPIHVGLVVAPGWMLHCERGLDSALERYDSLRWRNRLVGFWRHRSLGRDGRG